MRKGLPSRLAAVTMSAAAALIASATLFATPLPNGRFESDVSGWVGLGAGYTPGTIEWDSASATDDGTGSLRATNTTQTAFNTRFDAQYCLGEAVPGATYLVGGQVRADVQAIEGRVELGVRWFKEADCGGAWDYVTVNGTVTGASDAGWLARSGRLEAPGDAVSVALVVGVAKFGEEAADPTLHYFALADDLFIAPLIEHATVPFLARAD